MVQIFWFLFVSISAFAQSSPNGRSHPRDTSNAPQSASIRYGAQCSPAVPLAVGHSASIDGNWVAYARPDVPILFSPQIVTVGLFDLSTGQDFFPAHPNVAAGGVDFFPRIIDNTLFFVRMSGSQASVYTLDINRPTQPQVVESARSSPLFGFPGIMWARGGRESIHPVPDDFALVWMSNPFIAGVQPVANYCKISDCFQGVFAQALLPTSLGSISGARVADIDVSLEYGPTGGRPGFAYIMSQNNRSSVVAESWGTELVVEGPVNGGTSFSHISYSGPYLTYTRVLGAQYSKVVVTMPTFQGFSLFESDAAPGSIDGTLSLSTRPSGNGFLMAWTRWTQGSTHVLVDYFTPSQLSSGKVPLRIPLDPTLQTLGYDQCRYPSASGSTVVFECTSARFPGVPVIAKTTCMP